MSNETCDNCGAGTKNEPLVLCDECEWPSNITQSNVALRAENTALKARVVELEVLHDDALRQVGLHVRAATKAEARVVRLREALTGLLSRPFAKPGWSPEWDALVAVARAALSEETP